MAACGTAYMEHSVYPRCTQRAIMEANTMQETALLELRGICKFFPGVRALDGVDFTLRKGEIHALMGENGAGKSTLIKVLTGVYSKDEGTISMEGTPVQIRTTQDALKAGISTVYQEITLCPNLTVAENLYIGRTKGAFTNWRKMNGREKTPGVARHSRRAHAAAVQLLHCRAADGRHCPRSRYGVQGPYSRRADILS